MTKALKKLLKLKFKVREYSDCLMREGDYKKTCNKLLFQD